MTRFAIVQEDFREIPFVVLKQILTDDGGVNATDAARMARNNRGILGEHLEAQQAASVVRRLVAEGVPVRLMPADELPELKRHRTTRWFTLQKESFLVPVGISERTVEVPYSSVFVISSASIRAAVETDQAPAGEYSALVGQSIDNTPAPLCHVTEMIGYAEGMGLVHLRFPAAELHYTRILGEQTPQTRFQKYLRVVEQLVERCPHALVGPYTQSLLKDRREQYETQLGSWQEDRDERRFRQLNRWLLQLALIREAESAADDSSAPIV